MTFPFFLSPFLSKQRAPFVFLPPVEHARGAVYVAETFAQVSNLTYASEARPGARDPDAMSSGTGEVRREAGRQEEREGCGFLHWLQLLFPQRSENRRDVYRGP